MTCEDYPCCGHTDGLGCDWVSPNEIQPCAVCIEARVSRPYHQMWAGACPTVRAREMVVPANTPCENFSDALDSCDGEQADIKYDLMYLCFACHAEAVEYDRQIAAQYDQEGVQFVSSEPYPGAWRDAELHAYNYGLDDY